MNIFKEEQGPWVPPQHPGDPETGGGEEGEGTSEPIQPTACNDSQDPKELEA